MTRSNAKKIVLGVLVLMTLGLGLYIRFSGALDYEKLLAILEGISGWYFVVVYSVLRVSFIPTMPLNVGAGFLYGPLMGGIYSLIASTLGSTISFLLGRYLFHSSVRRRILPLFRERMAGRVDGMLKKCDWHTVAFVMLNPVFPTGPLSYFFGITEIRFFTYAWSTFLFTLPPTFLFSYFGETVRKMLALGDLQGILINIAILLVTSAGLFLLQSYLRKREEFQMPESRES